jgi:hypothetical protein
MINIALGLREFRVASLPAMALTFWLSPAAGWAYTYEQQQACMSDAFRLCSSEIPDIERVKACMVRQQSELSPACRAQFRPQSSEAAPGRPTHWRKHRPIRHAQRGDVY